MSNVYSRTKNTLSLTLFGIIALAALTPLAAAQSEPNVVLIVLDDMNDWTGSLGGHPQAQTPRIDALAAEGTLFSNAHAAAPICNPARASFMTGITPARSGITINQHQPWRDYLPDAVSLNQAFRDAGYDTVGYGKIYHGNMQNHDLSNWDAYTPKPISAEPPANQIPLNGFDDIDRGGEGGGDWGIVEAPASAFEDHKVATWATNFINGRNPNGGAPFFLAVGLRSTHSPWYFPSDYFARIANGNTNNVVLPPTIANDLDDVGPRARSRGFAAADIWEPLIGNAAAVRWGVHSYLAGAAFADDQVGRILDALQNSGMADNTIVVFLSDHGYHLSEKQTWQKQMLWEEDTHVPLIFRVPESLLATAADEVDAPVSLSALYPTLLELAGIPAPNYASNDPLYRIDYRSLVPLLDAGASGNWVDGPAVTFGRGAQATLRLPEWRFTLYENGFTELYDRQNDPHEWFNLANNGQYASLVANLRSDALDYLAGNHAPFGADGSGGGSVGGGGSGGGGGGGSGGGSGKIGNFVWRDVNGDGIQDGAEPGWAGVSVSLHQCDGPAVDSVSTDGNGNYEFTGVGPGRYQVAVALPSGASFSPPSAGNDIARNSDIAPAAGKTWCTTITSAGEVRPGLDAGLIPDGGSGGGGSGGGAGKIGDLVWRDDDGDGIQDNAEPGWAGVSVSLRECNGSVVDTTSTDGNGSYQFTGIAPGSYQIVVDRPPSTSFSPRQAGNNPGVNSDIRPQLGSSWCTIITSAGENRRTLDAGLIPQ